MSIAVLKLRCLQKSKKMKVIFQTIVHCNISVSIHVFGHEIILWPFIKTLD